MFNKPLILSLIRAELRNRVLTSRLEDMGFDCSYFIVDLSREILWLTGYKQFPESLFKIYLNLAEQATKEIRIDRFNEMLEMWSEMIYNNLDEEFKKAISN